MTENSSNKRILLIDDDITSLDIISFLFEDRGYRVDRCSGGLQALELLESQEFELALIDMMMPGLNGVETVGEIRSRGLADLPIVAFTATDDRSLHRQAIEAGCNKVLLKPIRSEKLIAEVEEFLSKEPSATDRER